MVFVDLKLAIGDNVTSLTIMPIQGWSFLLVEQELIHSVFWVNLYNHYYFDDIFVDNYSRPTHLS